MISLSNGFFENLERVLRLWRHLGFLAVIRKIIEKSVKTMRKAYKLWFPDLTWEQFERTVLTNRIAYRGVFIQDTVLDWDVSLFQRPQHMAIALANLGYLVIYKTPGVFDTVRGFRQIYPNIWLTNMLDIKIPGAVVSMYSSTAYGTGTHGFSHYSPDSVFVYEYIDHISPLINREQHVKRLTQFKEFAFKHADFIVTSARVLEREAIQLAGPERVLFIPNGVDVNHYRHSRYQKIRLPSAFDRFRKSYSTLVGYFGAIAPWLWYDMIRDLINICPDKGFVFIGPDYHKASDNLPRKENLLYLGPVDYKFLPAYARLFDICFIPFAPGEIAQTTSPLKLFEYFALEKPVVVTSDMLECIIYPEVFSGDSPETIAVAIDDAIRVKDDPLYKQKLSLLAEQNSWEQRATEYEKVFKATRRE
ncbi:MAG: hypothetical protein QXX08_10890 [Candidatus Bathyarchaeia archaeon]